MGGGETMRGGRDHRKRRETKETCRWNEGSANQTEVREQAFKDDIKHKTRARSTTANIGSKGVARVRHETSDEWYDQLEIKGREETTCIPRSSVLPAESVWGNNDARHQCCLLRRSPALIHQQ